MPIDLEKLNQEQRAAVVFGEGPLLIIAGAGTGKTTVITDRIVYLIETNRAKPEEILAVTFTEKAAGEMEERVDRALPFGYHDLWISTFHACAERILKENGLDIGLPTDFKLVDQTAAWLLVRQNLDRFDLNYYRSLGNPSKFIKALLSHFSRCKDQTIYPAEYLEYADSLKTNLTNLPEVSEVERIKELAEAFHVYQQLLLENNLLDFGDLINYCLQLLKQRPLILKKYQDKFKYVLVDEFQDTNKAQYELVKLVAGSRENLTVCADDDQAIYKWRGASVSNIKQFKSDYPKAAEVCLVKNYRSAQNILDLAYNFIQANNPNRLEYLSKINKKLIAQDSKKGIIQFLSFKTLEQEARGVASKIAELMQKDRGSVLNDFAILVRANDSALPFTRALDKAGIPYHFLASRGLYQKPVVLDIISYLKLLDNYHESASLYRILNLPFFQFTNQDIMLMTENSRKKAQSLYETLSQLSVLRGINPKAVNQANFLLALLAKHTEMVKEKSVAEILVAFLNDSGYLKYLTEQDKIAEIDLLVQFHKRVKSFEESSLDESLSSFISQLNWELEADEQGKLDFDIDQGPDMVKIMTIHSAKGLEFKYIFVVSLVDLRFPCRDRKESLEIPEALANEEAPEGDIHLQEERRLFYVALTRAKRGLFLTAAEDYGGQRRKKPSLFLIELGLAKPDGTTKKGSLRSEDSLKRDEKVPSLSSKEHYPLPNHFSYSQLAAFEKCPYQYKLGFILGIPAKGKASFSFGQSIHQTLNEFVKQYFQSNAVEQQGLFGFAGAMGPANNEGEHPIGQDELIAIYKKQWIDDWYESKKQKNEYHQLGEQVLKLFYQHFSDKTPQIAQINGQLALETTFYLKLGGYTIKGKIDRIDQLAGGVRLLDYKTGKVKEKLAPDDKTQLLLYQIACEEALGLNPVELSYYYLESGVQTSFLGSQADKERLKRQILEKIEKIKQSSFKATPGWQCQFCDFKGICPFVLENNDD